MLVCCLYFAPGLGDVAPYIRFGVPLESLAQDILQAGDTAVGAAVGKQERRQLREQLPQQLQHKTRQQLLASCLWPLATPRQT